jgi:hypothetical protein
MATFSGGGFHYFLKDVSDISTNYAHPNHGYTASNYIREINWRAPYRPRYSVRLSDFSTPIPIHQACSDVVNRFGDGGYEIYFMDGLFEEVGWGMLHQSFEGVDPYGENRFYELPTDATPVNSLGQLQHFNAAGYMADPGDGGLALSSGGDAFEFGVGTHFFVRYPDDSNGMDTMAQEHDLPIGNAVASRHIAREAVYNGNKQIGVRFDASWLLNTALWDRFYFSSIPQSGSFDVDAELLLNNRYRPIETGASVPSAESLRSSSTAFAAEMVAEGMFNVNSTSVEAWTAFLAGTLGVPYHTQNHDDEAVFARSANQDLNPASGGDPEKPLDANAWKGYRSLTIDQIESLASALVDQVQLRGPFYSLQQFVNRLPVASADDDAEVGIRGALEEAIRIAELNPDPEPPSSGGYSFLFNFMKVHSDVVDADHGFKNAISGAPGTVSQADLLQPLGPYISVRSDTFKIRSAGIVRDPVTNDLLSQVWCEAVVQRLPEYVDSSQPSDTALTDLNPTNLQLGRRFKLVSFRWLDKDEI